jgi:hypothetical protein
VPTFSDFLEKKPDGRIQMSQEEGSGFDDQAGREWKNVFETVQTGCIRGWRAY